MRIGKNGKKIIGRSVARDPKEKGEEKERARGNHPLVPSLLPVSDLDSEAEVPVREASQQVEARDFQGLRLADVALTSVSLALIKEIIQAKCTRTT